MEEEHPVPRWTFDGNWDMESVVPIKKITCDEQHFTFLANSLPDQLNYEEYTKFEKGKGRTKFIRKDTFSDITYDLVSTK